MVGGIGKTLIVIGLMMFGFVAYQLWGTGIYTARAQSDLDNDFDKVTTTVSPTSVAGSTSTTTTSLPDDITPGTVSDGTGAPVTDGTTTTTVVAPTTSSTLVPYPYAPTDDGDVLLRIEIPSIGIDWKVVEGVGIADLEKGPGHFPESVLPGQLGNSAIAGHRTTYGQPFYDVDKIDPGDEIVISYPGDGPTFTYVVTDTEIVGADDYDRVVPTKDPSLATLALSSCHPVRSASKRIIIRSVLVPEGSSPLFASTPVRTAEPDATLPAEDEPAPDTEPPSATTADTLPAGAVPVASDPAIATTNPNVTTTTPTTIAAVATTTAPPVASVAASEDAFSNGWFHDPSAWPHIIAWGLLLAAIAYGAYRLARRTRRIWLGTIVAFAPFLFVLYFFFENVNRLLPPGL